MTDRPTNREIADRLKRTWRYRWFELWHGRTFSSDMIAEIVASKRRFSLYGTAEWERTGERETLEKQHCQAFGISPLLWIALARLIIDLLRWWQERRK